MPEQTLIKGLTMDRLNGGPALLKLHYSADPEKDLNTVAGKKWVVEAARDYADGGIKSPGWRREMEMDPSAGSGELALPFLDMMEDILVVNNYVPSDEDAIFAGFDVGRNNPTALLAAAMKPDGFIIFFWEFYQKHVLLNDMAREVKTCQWYDRMEWIAADPSIWDRNQYKKDSMTSLAAMLQEEVAPEHRLEKMVKAHERSDQRFIQKLSGFILNKQKLDDGTELPQPKVAFSRAGCPILWRELRNLRYREVSNDLNNSEKLVDKDNHLADCAKYIMLSHPETYVRTMSAKVGTIGHLIEKSRIANLLYEEYGFNSEEEMLNAY